MFGRAVGKSHVYTEAERKALVTAIERRFQAGEGSLAAIARELGTCESSYYNWVKAGVTAAKATAPPYSVSDRERILAEAARLRAGGARAIDVAAAVGVGADTLRRWISEAAEARPAFRPVEVTEVSVVEATCREVEPGRKAQSDKLILISPGGYRLEGLGVATAAELLRALS